MPTPTLETVFSMRRLQDENGIDVVEVINHLTDETAAAELHVVRDEI
jgi:hypothetical protein